ncbi:MAG TPA: hypothetical protein VGN15_01470, partial [Ktedonobacteraceae bacterium]|nr:hypothetical protein [Ktedonobacteraceae bacterium]
MAGSLHAAPRYGKTSTLTSGLAMEKGRVTVVAAGPGPGNPPPRGQWIMPSPHCEMIVGATTAVPNSVYCVWSGQGEDRVLVRLFYDIDAAKKFAEEQFR